MEKSIYAQIMERTGGDIYIGVVGPVRTGKSTLIKRIMETLVIPNIEDAFRRERARDELPQSGSGKTIMTSEPKFVPEEAVEISPDGTARLRVRMIDSVGYMVDGAMGAMEDGKERMVTTPWFDQEIPMSQAAEIGTQRVMAEHCSVGLVVTTDGTITDIPRQDYIQAEQRAIRDMQATGKPFLVIVNSREPQGEAAATVCRELEKTLTVPALAMDCQTMDVADIGALLQDLLCAFPLGHLEFWLPRWMDALDWEHPTKRAVYDAILERAGKITSLSQAASTLQTLQEVPPISGVLIPQVDLGTGAVRCHIRFPEEMYYQILSERTGFSIHGEGELMALLIQLAQVKTEYDKIASALEETRATGYGIVMPTRSEMKLEAPELVRKGGVHGVRLRAGAPSIHMMRVDLDTEISPMVGSEQQAKDLVERLTGEFQEDVQMLWDSNIFGKSVFEMVDSSMETKLRRIPEDVRLKFRSSLARTVNEEIKGMFCILF